MNKVLSTTIVPIASYCYFLAALPFLWALKIIYSSTVNGSLGDFVVWLPVVLLMMFGGGFVAVGVGIVNANQLCWKILFFFLVFNVVNIASLIVVYLVSLFINANLIFSFYHFSQITPLVLCCLIFFYLSEAVVLYFLVSDEVTAYFGPMGDLISPF